MKVFKIMFVFVALLASSSAFSTQSDLDESKVSTSATTAVWNENVKNLGELAQGKPVTVVFEVKNSGDNPLVISKVKTSCGCTTSSYTKSAIPAGESGELEVTYNAKNLGAFTKSVTVFSNGSEGAQKLLIKGVVI
ncbi:DUF1573 domain-containing protein [Aureibacter tunicatorum]|uniref:DUF1573 domain-containing protein n=1 Tax=Aureibacter tunicatorum TaxID=866807 RepID=A0AAE3XSL0_9BACT|nr:DUF1573 domain-containing protein [Aureibacter tunicatorum]MDR6240799.1 hypothetical protein [Aureibacter tunicatorum]BDD06868.1 hypothetical protein AUTU_43510 [Aureibacter tunicatorum]